MYRIKITFVSGQVYTRNLGAYRTVSGAHQALTKRKWTRRGLIFQKTDKTHGQMAAKVEPIERFNL
ncbi:MAG: hypothetical protein A3A96_02695 [Candidatus Zambryskibacteria bacterium RIFCSPLOWO2_01_FULL_39_39]|uniref:Uncharacterized protein n=1 Tax=Candidatus Zambryskibacteria bacterium RIFCSPLOWO2_01_FULL_39_39 TaxID=1802758 RepID=A0A1G2TW53_9BACT|nr:MAG: hypothetical protein A2644_00400 [Candidatus Zambryskibacteria bacterium RIFCSPHIGHO2_01_FULL_39_63]OHA94488.1 MAG: hypothetical protein A3B88_02220 [Candidatus Zambryskibacteria bacterium RIFCSPHIGHO2_02_FULL_39_19]OHA99019.1 MAG: hypothetical protein A3F20_00545 [Candidatus Zambryskibacteria bacterium RIFCSPHIGHO2_12_FULL_39_21]OHB01558.1 MAG: hypothetical protein A3A96_02695 [Candidatus Zambryskibacteria bacterium RIFCSPLOWO2_01_FULL_39_39]